MKRFAYSLSRQMGIKPPPGYKDVDIDLPQISQRTRPQESRWVKRLENSTQNL